MTNITDITIDTAGSERSMMNFAAIDQNSARNKIEELEEHIDFLHTKIDGLEERIAILEAIILNKQDDRRDYTS